MLFLFGWGLFLIFQLSAEPEVQDEQPEEDVVSVSE